MRTRYPRNQRRGINPDHTNILGILLIIILILGGMSLAAQEDMKAQLVIDQAQINERLVYSQVRR